MQMRGADAPDSDLMEMRGAEPEVTDIVVEKEQRYHYPMLEESSRSNPVEVPWHLQGRPLMSEEGRSARVRRPPVRYTPDALMAEADVIEEVYNVVSAAYELRKSPVSVRKPYRPGMGANRVTLARAEASRESHESVYIISLREALKQFGADTEESLSKELTSLHVKGVIKPVMRKSLSSKQIKRAICSKMFLDKEKLKPSGKFEKLKSRYVAGCHMQHKDESASAETSSPTVGLQSIFCGVYIAAKEKRKVGSMDVGTAYHNAAMEKEVIMRVGRGAC
jgi:Reverse transcriptase (RNA-dependent DNA polymerase)